MFNPPTDRTPKFSFGKRVMLELIQAVTRISSCLQLGQIAETTTGQVRHLANADTSFLLVYDAEVRQVVTWYASEPSFGLDAATLLHDDILSAVLYLGQIIQVRAGEAYLDERTQHFLENNHVQVLLVLPLLVKNSVAGALGVLRVSPAPFIDNEIMLCQFIASQAAASIENARLYQSLKQHSDEVEAVYKVSLSLTASLNIDEVFDAILRGSLILIQDAEDSHIFLYEDGQLRFGAAQWGAQKMAQPWSVPRKNGLTNRVATGGKMIVVEDTTHHPLYAEMPDAWGSAIAGLPLCIGQRVVGVMTIAVRTPRGFKDSELRLLKLLGDQAAIAIENARLHKIINQQAHTDALTGISNRRAFDERLEEEMRRSSRYRHSFALMMLDMDNFKRINDTCGHPNGDIVLQQVAAHLRSCMRDTDFIARFGGDEFMIIMPETSRETAGLLGRRVEEELSSIHLEWEEQHFDEITAAIGIAVYPQDGQRPEDLLSAVDKNLYEAKRHNQSMERKPDG
ncbi:MAG: diguanylate cyclase [Chloroflexi bacterium]|nr:diguanylate cyclase [Chloroflexota bacterium]